MIGPISRKNWLTFGGDPVPDTDHCSTSLITAESGIWWDLLAFLTQSPADFHDTRQNDWCQQVNEPQYFGSDPAEIWIWIVIYLEIWLRIPDHFSSVTWHRSMWNCSWWYSTYRTPDRSSSFLIPKSWLFDRECLVNGKSQRYVSIRA